jgi:hypothetical protein
MSAIPATSYTSRVLVDGTLALTLHIEPRHARDAFQLFCAPGTEIALAALKTEPKEAPPRERTEAQAEAWESLGELGRWAVLRCREPEFQRWTYEQAKADGYEGGKPGEGVARAWILEACGVFSRKELDHPKTALIFRRVIVRPYAAWLRSGAAERGVELEVTA